MSPQQTEDVERFYYLSPVFGNGTRNGGDLLRVSRRMNERDEGPWYHYDKTVDFTIPNGPTIDFSHGRVIVAHVNMQQHRLRQCRDKMPLKATATFGASSFVRHQKDSGRSGCAPTTPPHRQEKENGARLKIYFTFILINSE